MTESVAEKGNYDVRDAIIRGCVAALPVEKSNLISQQSADLLKDFLNSKISLPEYHEAAKAFVDPGNVTFPDASTFRSAVKLWTTDDELTEENVRHEQTHYETATKAGFRAEYGMRFVKTGKKFAGCCNVHIDIPQTGDEVEIRKRLREVIEAPGGSMSETDKSTLSVAEPTLA